VSCVWQSIKLPLFSHEALYMLSMQLHTIERFWCTRLVSTEVVLVHFAFAKQKHCSIYTSEHIKNEVCLYKHNIPIHL